MRILQPGPVRTSLGYLSCICTVAVLVALVAGAFGADVTGIDVSDVFLIWATLSVCHAVHWHAWVTAPASRRPVDPT